MRIGLCGSISVGKTTLVKELSALPFFQDYHVTIERSKYLRDLGIPLNTDSTYEGQIIFAAERASELLRENLLTDRSIIDVVAFLLSSKSIAQEHKELLFEALIVLRNKYDLIIYVSPEGVEIEDNGVRETDAKYRENIDTAIKLILSTYPPNKFIEVKGSTEERIKTIMGYLEFNKS